MCGIVGYVGSQQAAPILLEGLKCLEYRGYDSAGIAVASGDSFLVSRAKGRLEVLIEKTQDGATLPGTVGIGHTRWATHGEPSVGNAHPHLSFHGQVIGVHNGIIENYLELKTKLERHDYQFLSQTDTEVAINLIEYYLDKYQMGYIHAIAHAMLRIRGSYALEVMFAGDPDTVYVARKDSPMIIGVGEGENFIASDVPALIKYTQNVYYIDNLELGAVTKDKVVFYNIDQEPIEKELVHVDMDPLAAEKRGYQYFMMKEIQEQPRAVRETLESLCKDGRIDLSNFGLTKEILSGVNNICIAACGSAYHAGIVGQYVIENLAKIPVRVELASELRYRNAPVVPGTLLIVVSQSGETADTLAALRQGKEQGQKTLAIVNVAGSSIARESDYVLPTICGPEIAVATTKAYSAQLVAFYALALAFADAKGKIEASQYDELVADLQRIPSKISDILHRTPSLQRLANRKINASTVFFIGRGLDYATCLEGSLKLKEISYIHSEAYPAGELKHGTISLVEKDTLILALFTQKDLSEKTLSNVVEVKARGANIISLDMTGSESIRQQTDNLISLPEINPLFAPSLSVVPLQLIALYIAMAKGLDVDKPRNLAKSVTVE